MATIRRQRGKWQAQVRRKGLLEYGLNVIEIATISGRKELRMLQRYSHLRCRPRRSAGLIGRLIARDMRDEDGRIGAAACIVAPSSWSRFQEEGDWQRLSWWIHDHPPYSPLEFFATCWAFNINWHEQPIRRIDTWVPGKNCLTKPGMDNHGGSHEEQWAGILDHDH